MRHSATRPETQSWESDRKNTQRQRPKSPEPTEADAHRQREKNPTRHPTPQRPESLPPRGGGLVRKETNLVNKITRIEEQNEKIEQFLYPPPSNSSSTTTNQPSTSSNNLTAPAPDTTQHNQLRTSSSSSLNREEIEKRKQQARYERAKIVYPNFSWYDDQAHIWEQFDFEISEGFRHRGTR